MSLLQSMSNRGKLLLGASVIGVAVVAFLLIIFTYLGVSYLLPGLHSYA
jgi:ABC-type transport system involved in cytochrome c biogenesis permease subunit